MIFKVVTTVIFTAVVGTSIYSATIVESAVAEVACSSEITYRWKRSSDSSSVSGGEGAPGLVNPESLQATANPEAPSASQTPPVDSLSPQGGKKPVTDLPGEIRVRYATVERRGEFEEVVRAGLTVELNRQKTRAQERCRRDHEAFGECVSTKLSTKTSGLNSLTFSARSELEKALVAECEVQHGSCLAVDSSELSCRVIKVAVPETPAPTTDKPAAGANGSEPVKAESASKKGDEKPKSAKK